jgi:leader peptidase (prepilin peptidase)/N-methyltransferase
MLRIVGTIFAGLLGLAFGSFLNVCLSRWPEGESIVRPRSHCRSCGRTLAWWENVPLISWIALRGRCRGCNARISLRYLVVELAVGALWAYEFWRSTFLLGGSGAISGSNQPLTAYIYLESSLGVMILCWALVGLAALDAEHFWLPNRITLPWIVIGIIFYGVMIGQSQRFFVVDHGSSLLIAIGQRLLSAAAAAAIILVTRWLYWLVRRREGVGLGDAKLMAMLAAWLGLPGALLSFVVGVMLGAVVAISLLLVPSVRRDQKRWAQTKLPLGTFLCVGGIVSSLWGEQIIHAYRQWAGF